MRIRSFGKLSDGRETGLYILTNKNGMEAHITDYGAALVRLIVPDRYGHFRDVVLGYDDAAGYEKGGSSFGGTVGRVANRISGAAFDLDGRHYVLTANNGPNCLHGGRDFYVHRIWSPVITFGKVSSSDLTAAFAVESMNDWSREPRGRDWGQDSIRLTLDSPDGDQGFPGAVHIEVTYILTDDNELHIDYRAELSKGESPALPASSAGQDGTIGAAVREILVPASEEVLQEPEASVSETPINLTNHSYFNLNGHDSGSVVAQEVWIDADKFTEADQKSIPTGSLLDVKWTPMDFRTPKKIGQDIDNDYEQLRFGNGYDHNYVLNKAEDGRHRHSAYMYSDDSGIKMKVYTDLPGLQLYTANGLSGEPGKNGAVYGMRSAACFETQFWPDTINKPDFPGGILREGEPFISRTTYKFSVKPL